MTAKVILLELIALICVSYTLQTEMQDKFNDNQVSRDLGISAPGEKCEVSYGSHEVNFGNELTKETTASQPSRISWPAASNKLYTVALVDPDAPSRKTPTYREWRHWVAVNVPGTEIGQGDVLTKYKGPGPPAGTGLHRYVFLVYEQQGRIASDEDLGERGAWKVRDFASRHKLNLVAGNFFQTKTE